MIKKITNVVHIQVVLMIVVAAIALQPQAGYAKDNYAGLKTKLEKLSTELEKKRKEYHIPGMAIAIVKNDEIIFSKGYGVTDIEQKTPVTPETIFAIGSSTKAFTATLVGMLADEGKIEWDAPITKYLPDLKFSPRNTDKSLTIRDMLSHRSGFARNDILWAAGGASRDKILQDAIKAEPWSDYGERFNYNNVMFLAAGVASAKQAKMDWDTLLQERLLKPLAMKSTSSVLTETQKDPRLSKGYTWREEMQKYEKQAMRNLANVAPAGAINSNVIDMSQWLKFQINKGVYNNQRLITEAQLSETRKSQIKVADSVGYGLGWFLREWSGKTVVEHGGNIDGFGAQVAFLPEEKLGFVLLTNVTATPLQQESMSIVWNHLLTTKDKQKQDDTSSKISNYAEYTGEYIANFASFKDATFTFLLKDGKPAVDVPGQTVYMLKDANPEGKWYFEMTDTISVSFDRDKDNNISAMRMQQNGMNFELPRKGVPIVAEIAKSKLQQYLGTYNSKTFKGNLNVVIQNHRLALDIPQQMVFELDLPDQDGHRQFRIKSDMSAVFDTDKKGQITSISIYRDRNKKVDTAALINKAKLDKLITIDEILALRKSEQRKATYLKSRGIELQGTVSMLQAGIKGKLKTKLQGKQNLIQAMDFDVYGKITSLTSSKKTAADALGVYQEFHGKYKAQALRDHYFRDLDWKSFYQKVEVVRETSLNDKNAYVIRLKHENSPAVNLFIDAKTGDILKQTSNVMHSVIGQFPVEIVYEDYREVNGLRFPFKTSVSNELNGKMVINYDSVKTNQNFDANIFTLKE